MRGFFPGRLVDRSAAVATVRYRWPIWVWLDGSLQAAVGNVFDEHLDGFKPSLLRFSSAIGVESIGTPDNSVEILCFGDQQIREGNVTVRGVKAAGSIPYQDPRHARFQDTMARNLEMAGMLKDVDVVHCHTWYTHLAGCLVKQLTGARLVLTTHSLEPHRPWKVEQLGTAYNASSWVERTAYENADGVIAVSASMRDDVHDLYGVSRDKIRVIHNGIDLHQYRPSPDPAVLGPDPGRPGLRAAEP